MDTYKLYTSTGHGFEGPDIRKTTMEMLNQMDSLIFNQNFNGRIIVVKYYDINDQDILEYEYLGDKLNYALFKRVITWKKYWYD